MTLSGTLELISLICPLKMLGICQVRSLSYDAICQAIFCRNWYIMSLSVLVMLNTLFNALARNMFRKYRLLDDLFLDKKIQNPKDTFGEFSPRAHHHTIENNVYEINF